MFFGNAFYHLKKLVQTYKKAVFFCKTVILPFYKKQCIIIIGVLCVLKSNYFNFKRR